MKRFLLFAGERYYPCGGWGDYRGGFGTEKEAKEKGRDLVQTDHVDWAHVVDIEDEAFDVPQTDFDNTLKLEKVMENL